MTIGNWGYDNGKIPESAMTQSGGVYLKPSTAAQCDGWLAAATAQGVALAFNEGYRDLATQAYWRTVWTNKGQPNNAAVPGTSTHGYGQAVDINRDAYTDAEYQIIIDTGAEFGMILNSNESWHFADAGTVTAQVAELAATPIPDPTPPTRRKKKMSLGDLVWNTNGTGILMTFDGIQLPIPDPALYALLYRVIRSDQTISPFNPEASGMPDQFFQVELDIMTQFTSLARVTRQTGVTIDAAKLASALSDALKGKSITAGGLSTADLAAAINEAVPRIAAAVTKAAGAKLSA